MRLVETPIPGAYVLYLVRFEDERGYFARTWCATEFLALGLNTKLSQCSISFNQERATLRGMHYQKSPYAESKVVRCTRGALYDVIVDSRPNSPAEGKYFAINLAAEDDAMLYVPEGVAHGYETLLDNTEVSYWISTAYEPSAQHGFRWDDPQIGIDWPLRPARISPRDTKLPTFGSREAP